MWLKMDKEEILKKLRELRNEDPLFRNGKIVSSVSTEPLDIALEAFRIFSDINALDSYVFPSVQKLEREIIGWFGVLLNNLSLDGYVTTGGTEANIAALYIAKKIHPKRKELIVPRSAHYSIQRAADLMGLRIKWTELDENFKADVDSIKSKINKNTLAIIATLGTSSLGIVDPIEEINDLCKDIFFHVDAAFGGFVLPFLDKRKIDFSLDNIDSITIDPHKMGLSLIPAGCILFKNETYLERLNVSPPYLPFSTHTLSGSRSGGAIAATWATLMHLDHEGYKKIVEECIENTKFLCNELKKISKASIVTEPELNIVGIKISDIESIAKELKKRGWKIAINRDMECIRVVVMPHVTKEVISRFLDDLDLILKNKLT